jgi:hypothetical protein
MTNLRAGDRWRAGHPVGQLNAAITAAGGTSTTRRTHTLNQLLPARHRRAAEPVAARAL